MSGTRKRSRPQPPARPIVGRSCNRCNGPSTGRGCPSCGCPEFRIVRDPQWRLFNT
jgi:hypothetical protein